MICNNGNIEECTTPISLGALPCITILSVWNPIGTWLSLIVDAHIFLCYY